MTKKKIVIAGGTGNLGKRIVKALVKKNASVVCLARLTSERDSIKELEQYGATVVQLDMDNVVEMAKLMIDASCVISVLAGLRGTIIDSQKKILEAAVAAGVPRFVPSDYSLDFTKFKDINNRNLELRSEFHTYLDISRIQSTSIFNGAFMDMLTNEIPMIIFKKKLVLYWGNKHHKMAFTTMDDTANFTAEVALDEQSPRILSVAGDQKSPEEIRGIMNDLTGQKFRLLRLGGPNLLSMMIKLAKLFSPGKTDLYPAWQGMQYMHNMIDKRSTLTFTDNDRYPDLEWTGARELLSEFLSKQKKAVTSTVTA